MPIFRPHLSSANVKEAVLDLIYDHAGTETSEGIKAYNNYLEGTAKGGEDPAKLLPFRRYSTIPYDQDENKLAFGDTPALSVNVNRFSVEESTLQGELSLHNLVVSIHEIDNEVDTRYIAGELRKLSVLETLSRSVELYAQLVTDILTAPETSRVLKYRGRGIAGGFQLLSYEFLDNADDVIVETGYYEIVGILTFDYEISVTR